MKKTFSTYSQRDVVRPSKQHRTANDVLFDWVLLPLIRDFAELTQPRLTVHLTLAHLVHYQNVPFTTSHVSLSVFS